MPMRKSINQIFKTYYKLRYKRMERFMRSPHEMQLHVLNKLLRTASHTEFGQNHRFSKIQSPEEFARFVPINDYEDLKSFIDRMMLGERNVLWPGKVKWFSKSSGTTSSKSKFIPVPKINLRTNHIRGTWDTMNLMYHHLPNAKMFERKSLIMGGSLDRFKENPEVMVGDVSAIMTKHMPKVAHPFFTPDFETALMSNYDEKIEKMAHILCDEKDMVCIGGVPTWTIVLFNRILEITGKDHMLEVWPNLQAYIHGGVSFTPYREQFQKFLPSSKIVYQETYNASEGFFAVQDLLGEDQGMLLLLDNGIYYEFIPMDQWGKAEPQAITLKDVKPDVNYALVISTNGGLWRYTPGDTICFTSTDPYRIKVTGRTKQFINAFGEEVMVANTDMALTKTCTDFGALVSEYTVAPIYLEGKAKGGHQWLIEFEKAPVNLPAFAKQLDLNLQMLNSDYEAKRFKGLALDNLTLEMLPKGSFIRWMKAKNKYGGQHKIPRLSNNRQVVDEILGMLREDFG